MDAEEEEAPIKPLPPPEQGFVTALDVAEPLLTTAPQCDIEPKNLPHAGLRDEPAGPPAGPAFVEEEKDLIERELSEAVATGTSMEKRDQLEFIEEKEKDLHEVAEATEVVVVEERVVAEDAGLPLKNEGIEIADLAYEGCETKVISEVEGKVAADTVNVAGEEVQDGIAWKAEGAEDENAIGMSCAVAKKTDLAGPMVDAVDGVRMKGGTAGADDIVAERELTKETNVADMAVEIMKVEEGADGAAVRDKTEELLVGTETADRAYVDGTMSETTELDGADMEHGIREADDEVEVAVEVNEIGTVEATADAEEEADDGPVAEEEVLEAEEAEIANDASLMEEEVGFADMTDDTEAAEEAEEMEVAEELSRSISGGKRKRGKNSKPTGRVTARKKVEEDVCFICFDGGELVLCDRR